MPVSDIQVISDLQRPAVRVVIDVQHPHHWDARIQFQHPCLIVTEDPGKLRYLWDSCAGQVSACVARARFG